jgi:hypothetical protein
MIKGEVLVAFDDDAGVFALHLVVGRIVFDKPIEAGFVPAVEFP